MGSCVKRMSRTVLENEERTVLLGDFVAVDGVKEFGRAVVEAHCVPDFREVAILSLLNEEQFAVANVAEILEAGVLGRHVDPLQSELLTQLMPNLTSAQTSQFPATVMP